MAPRVVRHPGAILWSAFLEPLGLTVTDAADALGVSRKTLSALINGRQGVSPEMSVRLSIALRCAPDAWLQRQTEYDMSQVGAVSGVEVLATTKGRK